MSKDNGHFFPNLDGAAIGRPITRAGISFFPVYLLGERGCRRSPPAPPPKGSSTNWATHRSGISR